MCPFRRQDVREINEKNKIQDETSAVVWTQIRPIGK